jgi:hypothetical protein
MTLRLEEELAEGMRTRTSGLRPPPDLVARAARQWRRRRRRGMAVAGLGAGAAVVAAAAFAFQPAGTAPPRLVLTAAQVSERAMAALSSDDVLHVTGSLTVQGRTGPMEYWFDPVTNDSRRSAPDGGGYSWMIFDGGVATITAVDPASRTWWSDRRTVPDAKAGKLGGASPDELRAALRDGAYGLVGPATVGGVAATRLRASTPMGVDDLWVDTATYRTLRREIVKHDPDGDAVIRLDFTWQPRTDASLAPLRVAVPAGYTRVGSGGVPR